MKKYCYLIFTLSLYIFTQFIPLLSELTLSEYHIVRFANYPTAFLWDSSAILYSPLRRTNIIQTTTSTKIDPISSAFSTVRHTFDPIEETSDHQFFLILYLSQ